MRIASHSSNISEFKPLLDSTASSRSSSTEDILERPLQNQRKCWQKLLGYPDYPRPYCLHESPKQRLQHMVAATRSYFRDNYHCTPEEYHIGMFRWPSLFVPTPRSWALTSFTEAAKSDPASACKLLYQLMLPPLTRDEIYYHSPESSFPRAVLPTLRTIAEQWNTLPPAARMYMPKILECVISKFHRPDIRTECRNILREITENI